MKNCEHCDGTGYTNKECDECGRDGFLPDVSDGGYMTCPDCDSESSEMCSYCEGDGCIE